MQLSEWEEEEKNTVHELGTVGLFFYSSMTEDRSTTHLKFNPNSWPPDHYGTFHVTEMPALSTRSSVTFPSHSMVARKNHIINGYIVLECAICFINCTRTIGMWPLDGHIIILDIWSRNIMHYIYTFAPVSQDEILRKRLRKQIWVHFFGKSGNSSLLSYFEYAESKNVSRQIFIWPESPQFSLLK